MSGKSWDCLSVCIGTRDVGRLIGSAGANINAIRDESGCRIKIGDASRDDPKSTSIKVYGATEEARKACEQLIFKHLGYYTDQEKDKVEEAALSDEPIDWAALLARSEEMDRERWANCPKLLKDFYEEHPEVTKMPEEQVEQYRKDNNNIVVSNFDPESPAPLLNPAPHFYHSFERFPDIMKTINKQGFSRPSPIQAQGWPYLLSGKDLIGIAQTGTGKTLAFLLPSFIHIEGQPIPRGQRMGPNVLILSPTRELALQIAGEIEKYDYKGIRSVCVYGGGDRRGQMRVITEGVEIIIATPGRLNDLVQAGCINVESITYLVLDEADRMLDLGFEPQIRKVLMDIRPDRQTVMTSATWPEGVRRMASSYMKDPVTVFIGTLDLAAVQSVQQHIVCVKSDEEKDERLQQLFDTMSPTDKVIVFVGKKARVDDIATNMIIYKNINCQTIHGDREQCDRERALEDLKTGVVQILIATDVASRGIDITDVTHVFNYDFPRNIEEYVHRVGRTGRAGRSGTAITLMERRDWKHAQELISILRKSEQEVPSWLHDMAARYKTYKEKADSEKAVRGGSGDGCFNCGEPGHFSRECPARGGKGGNGGGRARQGRNDFKDVLNKWC